VVQPLRGPSPKNSESKKAIYEINVSSPRGLPSSGGPKAVGAATDQDTKGSIMNTTPKQNLLVHPPQWLCYGGRAVAFPGAMALITVVARAGTVGQAA
jgi:hypothetical protein